MHTIAGSSFNSSGQGGRRSSISGLDKDLQGLLAQLEADGHIIVNPIAHPPSQGPSSRHMMSSHGAPSSSFSNPLNVRPPSGGSAGTSPEAQPIMMKQSAGANARLQRSAPPPHGRPVDVLGSEEEEAAGELTALRPWPCATSWRAREQPLRVSSSALSRDESPNCGIILDGREALVRCWRRGASLMSGVATCVVLLIAL